ncbi:MAG: DUF72 domain-containing protein [Chloroflexota bacterium]
MTGGVNASADMLYIGTSGWSYPKGGGAWDGVFYPAGLPDRDKLAFYAQYFSAVELNSSFYRPPAPAMARAWAARTPPDFKFGIKLWQKFTHPKMFRDATGGQAADISEADYELFLEGILPLAEAGKVGAVLAQFPPSFRPADETRARLTQIVEHLYRAGLPTTVELRHREWTDPEGAGPWARDLLAEHGVAWTLIDEPRFKTSIRDIPRTGDFAYFRFHGRNYQQWWKHDAAEDRYNYQYNATEQRELAAEVQEATTVASDVYVFYNNHYRAKAVVNGLELRGLFNQPAPPPLPESLLSEYPGVLPS